MKIHALIKRIVASLLSLLMISVSIPIDISQKVLAYDTFVYGIDVSDARGTIDWDKVKAAGVEFAIIDAGYGNANKYPKQKDKCFDYNYSNAKRVGIKCGVYWFSYASSIDAAIEEADSCYNVIKDLELEYPVFFDVENDPNNPIILNSFGSNKQKITEMTLAFCDRLASYGVKVGVYCNTNWFNNYVDKNQIINKGYYIWQAHYYPSESNPELKYDKSSICDIWQYSEKGHVDGINGYCDLNVSYKNFYNPRPAISNLQLIYPSGKGAPSGNLKQGASFGIYGTITNGIPIRKVWGGVYKTTWLDLPISEAMGFEFTPNTTTYDLHTEVNNKIIFNNLPPGEYRWLVFASDDENDKVKLADSCFNIVGDAPPVIESNITIANATKPTGTLKQGSNFGVYGNISSNLPIQKVWGGIYKQGTDTGVETVEDTPNATSYNLHGKFNNNLIFNNLAVGNYTYKIYAKDSQKTYTLINSNFSIGTPQPSSMTISDQTIPSGSLELGANFGIYGIINSNLPITKVWGGIYKQDTDTGVQTVEDTPNATSYNLHGKFNNNLIFNNLAVGYYTYKIYAKDSQKTYTLINSNFSVGDSTVSSMTIKNQTIPSRTLKQGNFFGIYGDITSTLPITKVFGGVYNHNGSKTSQYAESYPNTTTYSLYPTFDNKIIFNRLGIGQYTYKIEATDSSGKTYTLINSNFQIENLTTITTTTTTTTRTTTTTTITTTTTTAKSTTTTRTSPKANGGFSEVEIEFSPVQPKISATKKIIKVEESKNVQQVDISVSGANGKYCSTEIHIYYDKRLEISLNRFEQPDVWLGDACKYLATIPGSMDSFAADYDMEGIKVLTYGENDYGKDGVYCSFNVILPEDAKPGDVFPIDIVYWTNGLNESLFVNKAVDRDGKLMQAYAWTQGIYNEEYNNNFKAESEDISKCSALADISRSVDGYIAIADVQETITTTITITTTTETTTTTPPVTTEPIKGAGISGDANDDGLINLKDVIIIRRYIAGGWNIDINAENADVNNDDKIDLKDVILIRRYIAGGWDIELV